jgi:predicted PurR-regulated permease PerM
VFSRKITVLFPNPEREVRVRRILQQIGTEVQSYLWMKTLMGLLVTGLSYVVMKAVGLDLAEFWALLIFALSYIPYIGAWVGVIFPTALALVQFEITTPFFVTAGLLAVIQFTCGSILEPRIMGKGPQYQPDGDVAMPFDLGRNLGHRRDVPRSTHHGGRDDCLLTLRSHTPGGDPAVG